MAGRSFMREFEDPFFSDHRDHISRMMSDPFAGFHGAGMLEDGRSRNRGSDRRGGSKELAPFDENFGFGSFGRIFEDMHQNMNRMMEKAQSGMFDHHETGGNGQMYHQASVMSYSNTGQGPPKVFQASKSTRTGPGGVRETRKAVRDSERELEKMAIGHHIHQRGREVERHRNSHTGQTEEYNKYDNMDEAEAPEFDREWEEKTKHAFRGLDYGDRRQEGRNDRRTQRGALLDSRQRALPALEGGRSEHWGRTPNDRRRDRS